MQSTCLGWSICHENASLLCKFDELLACVLHLQAALPQGIVPFVFAKEYNVHPDILSTGLVLGTLLILSVMIYLR